MKLRRIKLRSTAAIYAAARGPFQPWPPRGWLTRMWERVCYLSDELPYRKALSRTD